MPNPAVIVKNIEADQPNGNQAMQDIIDAFDYARAQGTREPTQSDIQQFMDLAYDLYRKPVLDISQRQRDQIAAEILEN